MKTKWLAVVVVMWALLESNGKYYPFDVEVSTIGLDVPEGQEVGLNISKTTAQDLAAVLNREHERRVNPNPCENHPCIINDMGVSDPEDDSSKGKEPR